MCLFKKKLCNFTTLISEFAMHSFSYEYPTVDILNYMSKKSCPFLKTGKTFLHKQDRVVTYIITYLQSYYGHWTANRQIEQYSVFSIALQLTNYCQYDVVQLYRDENGQNFIHYVSDICQDELKAGYLEKLPSTLRSFSNYLATKTWLVGDQGSSS